MNREDSTRNPDDIELAHLSIEEISFVDAYVSDISDISSDEQEDEQDDEQDNEPHSAGRLMNMLHRFQGGFFFVFTVFAVGFVFISSQSTAAWASSSPSSILCYKPMGFCWWWEVDAVQLFYSVAILSATVHFTLNVHGGASYKHILIVVMLAWAVVILTVMIAPNVYQQTTNITTISQVDRGGCHSIKEKDDQIPLLGNCFLGDASDAYVHYQTDLENLHLNSSELQNIFFVDGTKIDQIAQIIAEG